MDHLFSLEHTLHELSHYLPAQSSLKDFVHHNTLHAFQDRNFFDALTEATQMLGVKTRLSLREFRNKYACGEIKEEVLLQVLGAAKGAEQVEEWKRKLLDAPYEESFSGRIGQLRRNWKRLYGYDLDLVVHPLLFRLLCSYSDQGIAINSFPVLGDGFLDTMRKLEEQTYVGLLRTPRAKNMLMDETVSIERLLDILVGKKELYERYLFDQQFAHPGWSGMVSVIEHQPETLLDSRQISLKELIHFELLMEIDELDDKFGENWIPLGLRLEQAPELLFQRAALEEYHEVLRLWQLAMEWSFFDEVVYAIQNNPEAAKENSTPSFQALFCIDDREQSLRRYIEQLDSKAVTYGTPGYFGVEFFYRPMDGKFNMKVCPAPVTPKYLIKEETDQRKNSRELHFSRKTHGLIFGYLITHTIGFWSAVKLFFNLFTPRLGPASASSFKHMDRFSKLTVEHHKNDFSPEGLQVGFTKEQMAYRVANVLKSIGLVNDFAPLIYVVGHGASSINNTHYAGYDCGACCGRPGSVNARVFCYMANDPDVRTLLATQYDLNIPNRTVFIGALHDTTRDEIEFYDDQFTDSTRSAQHKTNGIVFKQALAKNAKERARRFETTSSKGDINTVHERVKRRSVSLFEPRPELNHATNALCIIGRPALTDGLFLDRRAFMNSYDYRLDPQGDYLFQILSAATPVCGGINLEYYFSRVDNQKLGAGSKLPHNVMGLIGVANGIDGDLRPGLPSQMIELHDPLRILFIIEQQPDVVMATIRRTENLYNWYQREWVLLMVVEPETKRLLQFLKGDLVPYIPETKQLKSIPADDPVLTTSNGNLPIYHLRIV